MTEKLHNLRQMIKKNADWNGVLLALDPGETTGWAILECASKHTKLIAQGQVNTWPIENAVNGIGKLLIYEPTKVVYEAYHVYSWRLNEHSFSDVPTIQIIGCLRTLAVLSGVGCDCQTAQTGKAF